MEDTKVELYHIVLIIHFIIIFQIKFSKCIKRKRKTIIYIIFIIYFLHNKL